MPRNIDKNLKKWAASIERRPLVLRGARQVGKSASINNLGQSFSTYVIANFESTPDLFPIFDQSLDPVSIIRQIEVILGERIVPGETLLFFDEIQECPRALTSLRYFKEKMPELHLIAAGSLLEFVLGKVSFPVGRVDYEYLFPMSFREFLVGTEREVLAENIPKFDPNLPLDVRPGTIGKELNRVLKEYLIVGGMPEAVSVYAKTKSYLSVAEVHDRLIRGYLDDIPKYVKSELQIRNVSKVFAQLASNCGKQVTFSKLFDDDSKRNKNSVFLLEQAMLIHLAKATSPEGLPLGVNCSEKIFKPIFIDIGLAQRMSGRDIKEIALADDIVASLKGQVAEQFVGQQMLAESKGSEMGKLYYWRRAEKSSTAEVDFLVSRGGKVIPVEVKSGSSGRLKSLHLVMETYQNIEYSLCLQSIDQASQHKNIYFLPLYTEI